jgi:hypothetical protein
MEHIIGAVFKCRVTDEIFTGVTHLEARELAFKNFLIRQDLTSNDVTDDVLYASFLNNWIAEQSPMGPNEGFASNYREWISREDAYFVALNSDQTKSIDEKKLNSEKLE